MYNIKITHKKKKILYSCILIAYITLCSTVKDTRGRVQGRLPKPQLTQPRWRMCFNHHSLELRGPFYPMNFQYVAMCI